MNKPYLATRPNNRTLHRVLIPAVVGAAMAVHAYGAASTWQGASTLFSNSANWSGGALTGTETLTFPAYPVGTAGTSLTNDVSGIASYAGVTFGAGAGNYTITSNFSINYGTLTGNNPGGTTTRAGAITFESTGGTLTLNNGANNNIGDGDILVLKTSGTGSIVLTGAQAGFLRSRDFYKTDTTTDYAYNGGSGIIRAPIYNSGAVDGGGGDNNFYTASTSLVVGATVAIQKHNLITSSITGQTTGTVTTMKFLGAGAIDVGLGAAQQLNIGNGSGSFPGAILRTGGGTTTFSGGTGVQFGSGLIWYIYTDTAADTVTFNTPILALSTNHFSKNGLGTVVVGSTNAITGQTFVNEGTLLVNGSHTGGATYWVNGGAKLGGTGTITTAPTANVQVSGTLAPGDSLAGTPSAQTGTLTISTLSMNFAGGSTFAAQLGGTTAGAFDKLALTNTAGAITLASNVALSLNWVGGSNPSGTYLILDTTAFTTPPTWGTLFSGTTNGGSVGISGLPGGYTGTISYGNSGVTITVVPEPTSYAAGVVAVLGLTILLRRRSIGA